VTDQNTSNEAPEAFPRTRWSVVLAARQRQHPPESAAALETICRSYWYPLYAFVRRSGYSPPDAEDLTQEFFCRLLEKHWLDAADRDKGRLRTFLVVAMKRLLAKEWRRASAQRRGSGQSHVSVDTAFAESRYAAAPAASLAAEAVFDREWALTLLDLTLERLRAEFAAAGKPGDFEALKGCLMAAGGTIDYAAVAERLGTSQGAARVAVHRLRKRFRQVCREEVSQTLANGTDLDTELRHLAAALA
jgi:RNA polymerase sigma-70 factor (ECF subfamily)